jgi:hypothetical protein
MPPVSFDRRLLFILIALEAVVFFNFYYREVAWYPAQHYDQNAYLFQAYELDERVFSKSLGAFFTALRSNENPSGLLLPIEGALAGLLIGGTRLPQLLVLFISFCALQVFAFATAQAVWGRRAYGYLLLGLILCQTTAWSFAGGLFDFRMDFVAYCLYGIWTCAVVRSNLFLERRWAIGCGLIGAFLVLHRFITIIYLLGVCAGFALACLLVGLFLRGDPDLPERLKRRLLNLALAAVILIVLASPVLLVNWGAIHDYYVLGHATGQEKYVRATEFGVHDLVGNLLFYPKSIVKDHLGRTFLRASLLAIAIGAIARLLSRGRNAVVSTAPSRTETYLLRNIFLLGSVLGPVIVLTVDISKSPVVGGIVGVPVALFVVALSASDPRELESNFRRTLIVACGVVIFVFGLSTQFQHACRHLPEYAQRKNLEKVADLDRWLVRYANDYDWHNPRISFDVISGWFNSRAITVSGYEQSHMLIDFGTLLGGGIMGVERPEALSMLANSDFAILTTIQKEGVYPFYEHISRYWSDLKAWADLHMIVARTVPFDRFTATIYVRPSAKVSGLSEGWVTHDGLTIEATPETLRRFPLIRLFGNPGSSRLPKAPTVTAMIDTTGAKAEAVPASIYQNSTNYEILIDLSNSELPQSDPVRLRLNFNTFFISKKTGVNDSPRELVLPAPNLVRLSAPSP